MDTNFDLSKVCGATTFSQLENVQEQPAAQFLKGQATSAFASATALTNSAIHAKSAITMASNIDYSYLKTRIKESTEDYVKQRLEALGKKKREELTNKAMSLATYVATRTTYWTTYYTKDMLKEAKEALLNDQDKAQENAQKEERKKEQKQKIADLKQKTAYITQKIQYTTALINENVTNITNYITAGPSWIEKNIQKTIDKTLNTAEKEIDKLVDKGYEEAEKFFDSKAEEAGQRAAAATAKALKDKTAKALSKANKSKVTAITYAKAALQLVKQKAMALIGM